MREFTRISRRNLEFRGRAVLVAELKGTVVFEPEYRNPDMLRGLEGFSHIWLIWSFSESKGWSPTVRPPRLGGNRRMGVFAIRSPFRPNAIGLSSVVLERVELHTERGPVLHVSGVDLMDGTPIFDIKPYVPYADSHPEARGGFVAPLEEKLLAVDCPEVYLELLPEEFRQALLEVLPTTPARLPGGFGAGIWHGVCGGKCSVSSPKRDINRLRSRKEADSFVLAFRRY